MTAAPPEVVFLLARLDETEAAARATAQDYPPPWRGRELDDEGDSMETGIVFDAEHREVVYWEAGRRDAADRLGAHIVRHDPARVLADCAFKRALVRRFIETAPPYADARQQEIHETLRDEVIEPMAQLWADHPAFDPSWRV